MAAAHTPIRVGVGTRWVALGQPRAGGCQGESPKENLLFRMLKKILIRHDHRSRFDEMLINLKVTSQDKSPMTLSGRLPKPHLVPPARSLEVLGLPGWKAGSPVGGFYHFWAAGGGGWGVGLELEAGRRGRSITYTGVHRGGVNGAAVPAGKWSPVLLRAQTHREDSVASASGYFSSCPQEGFPGPSSFRLCPFSDANEKTKALCARVRCRLSSEALTPYPQKD
jgi:hypothetical protein